jgi:chemotaxis protein methyltransferase CheR
MTFLRVRLEDRLRGRGIAAPRDYYYFLKFHPDGPEELQVLIDAVTTQETWFFRETEPLESWCASIAPGIVRSRGKLRAWSAACSTGEEAFTLAMLVAERFPDVPVEIVATDISRRAIAVAREGLYDAHSLRRTGPQWVSKYFRPAGGGRWEVGASIRNAVRFEQANLLDPAVPQRVGPMDFVLCRNVLIYFDERSRNVALTCLRDALRPDGNLVLGFSESLSVPDTLFDLVRLNGSVLYRKHH